MISISSYPRWKYHEKHEPVLVENSNEEDMLGEGWGDSPADFGVVTAPSRAQVRERTLQQAIQETKESTEEQVSENAKKMAAMLAENAKKAGRK